MPKITSVLVKPVAPSKADRNTEVDGSLGKWLKALRDVVRGVVKSCYRAPGDPSNSIESALFEGELVG